MSLPIAGVLPKPARFRIASVLILSKIQFPIVYSAGEPQSARKPSLPKYDPSKRGSRLVVG